MTKTTQAKKNLRLSEKLVDYLMKHPKAVVNRPKHVSFIVFSSADEALNKENEKLIDSVIAEGKKLIKAIQTKDKSNPWKFSQVAY